MSDGKSFYTVDEVAELVRRTPKNIREKIAAGELGAHAIGGRYLISRDDVRAFLERARVQTGAASTVHMAIGCASDSATPGKKP